MKGYSATQIFPKTVQEIYHRVCGIPPLIPDRDGGMLVRCHEVARIVAELFPRGVTVVDGFYQGPHVMRAEHSWLEVVNSSFILDVYAVGRLPLVQLIHAPPGTAHREAYKDTPYKRDDIRTEFVQRTANWIRENYAL